jgi:phage regulator Rha-like protein
MLQILTQNEQLVVDSRLIAIELEIKHENLRRTVEKYLNELQAFGVIVFETSKPSERSLGGRPERFCFLNEDQATFLMTLSRNTPQVVACKMNLVTAFSKAKQIIQTVIPQQSAEIEKLKLELELAKTQERLSINQSKLLASVHLLETISPGLAPLALGKADAVIERVEYIERVIDKSTDRVTEGVGITYLTKKFGFNNNNQTWQWLESIGYGKDSDKWETQLAAVTALKLPKESVRELENRFKRGVRQQLLGE